MHAYSACFPNSKMTMRLSPPNGFSVLSMDEAFKLSIFSGLLTLGPALHIIWLFYPTIDMSVTAAWA